MAEPRLPPLVVLCGPTATGKTRLSLALATSLGGLEIVGADSRQVYRGMDVGTAKVTPAERALVPHHGLDLVWPDEAFSVARYRDHVVDALVGIADRGRCALLVGGTGLYVRAVARGMPLDETPPDHVLRAELEDELRRRGVAPLAERLVRVAPTVAAATDLANPRRVVRALERTAAVGDRLPPAPRGYPAPVLWLGLQVEPALLRMRIADRAARQFSGGLLEEVEGLLRRFPADLPAMSAIGYREATDVVHGRASLAEALAATVRRTTAFARRQRTWFRGEPELAWLDAAIDPYPVARGMVEAFLSQAP